MTMRCPNCDTLHHAERDEDGASFPTGRCEFPGCSVRLCADCPKHRCECGRTVCLDHTAVVGDGTPEGLRLCELCRATDESYEVCECRFTGDQADARECAVHGGIAVLRPITRQVASLAGIPEFAPAIAESEECPF